MSKALNDLLERLRKRDDPNVKEWQGRLNYTSPRMAEEWKVPDRQLKFETGGPANAARQVMADYREENLEGQGHKTPQQIFAERTDAVIAERKRNPNASRLSPFEQPFRVDQDDLAAQNQPKRGLFRRLFGWK